MLPTSPASLSSSSLASPPAPPPSLPAALPTGTPHSGPGSLHLCPSNLDDFLELPNTPQDRYHLIDGVLYHQPRMPDPEHGDIQAFITTSVEAGNLNLPRHKWRSAYFEADVAKEIPKDPLDIDDSPAEKHSDVIADIAIGRYQSATDRGNLSPSSQKMRFPPGRIPHLMIEVTSPSNRLNDICSKAVEYARMKVPQYVIVDRKNRCITVHSLDRPENDSAGPSRRRSARLSESLPPSGYPLYSETQKFYGATVVRVNVLEELALTAENLLKPKRTPTEMIGSPVRKSQLERDDAKRERDDSRNKEKDARNNVRTTERERDDAKRERDDAKRERDDARNKVRTTERERDDAKRERHDARNKKKDARKKAKERKNTIMQLNALMNRRGIEVSAELQHNTDDFSGSSRSSTASPERQRSRILNRN